MNKYRYYRLILVGSLTVVLFFSSGLMIGKITKEPPEKYQKIITKQHLEIQILKSALREEREMFMEFTLQDLTHWENVFIEMYTARPYDTLCFMKLMDNSFKNVTTY